MVPPPKPFLLIVTDFDEPPVAKTAATPKLLSL
jgi:hypothetical protein